MRTLTLLTTLLALLTGCAHQRPAPRNDTLRIYLARHGQTDWNALRKLQGQSDTELNATGRDQAILLRSRIEGVPIDQIYSSALKRSRVTAEIAGNGRSVIALPALNERHLGRFEGLHLGGADAAMEAEYRRRSKSADDTLDGGESHVQMYARICGAVNDWKVKHRGGSILVVAHGGSNQAILRCLLDLSFEEAERIQQNNDELYLIETAERAGTKVWKLIPADSLAEL